MARLATTLAILTCGGCGTVANHNPLWNGGRDYGLVYGGVRHDFEAIRETTRPVVNGERLGSPNRPVPHAVWVTSLVLLDLPLSLVADTLWLPHDLRKWRQRRHAAPPAEVAPAAELPPAAP